MMQQEYVILVDEQDNETGVMEKLQAHEEGKLHRAFSVFIFNDKDELLLQQRALNKYHSGGLWTNTCCSHPRPNETIKDAANRRLFEEMGMVCDLKIVSHFIYKSEFENGLIEHELDYILIGKSTSMPKINTNEVETYKWQSISQIKNEIALHPTNYTTWFKIAMQKNIF
jgi:isopentenyl-diphosphate delta-isomerase